MPKTYIEKRQQEMMFRKLNLHTGKINIQSYHLPQTEINSKWIKDLNARLKTQKLLKQSIRKDRYRRGLSRNDPDCSRNNPYEIKNIIASNQKLSAQKNLKLKTRRES